MASVMVMMMMVRSVSVIGWVHPPLLFPNRHRVLVSFCVLRLVFHFERHGAAIAEHGLAMPDSVTLVGIILASQYILRSHFD